VGVTVIRGLIAGLGALLMVGGIALVAVPAPRADVIGALIVFGTGAVMVAGVLLERTRYRSLHAEHTGDSHGPGGGETARPDGRFRPTDERFVDPTTGTPMRVWIDPATGDQRYVAEG
jgi:hypothetical protein